ncbi:hypothetical protein ACI7RC_18830 [Brevibacillus sp. B_LB10_24]|uniref:hypothetical protein n=1 Tax=Brevibacillus sp. B_LB10_24 TaxID=3380645 RepID=UPI0038BAC150
MDIRNVTYGKVISVIDEWWGRRRKGTITRSLREGNQVIMDKMNSDTAVVQCLFFWVHSGK